MGTSQLNEVIKLQFDKQFQSFSNWSVTKNEEYLQAYSDFCLLNSGDSLLDAACGTGEFVLFSSSKVKHAHGADISKGMINLAVKQAADSKISNSDFLCSNIEHLPFCNNSFSVVICKSAFHHFSQYRKIFKELTRCCCTGGRISVQDIIAYPDKYINNYFEELEKEIDISHNVTLPKEFIIDLYEINNIKVINTFELEVELNLKEYLAHAYQSAKSIAKIKILLEFGINDKQISKYFIIKEDGIYFKRSVFCILGKK